MTLNFDQTLSIKLLTQANNSFPKPYFLNDEINKNETSVLVTSLDFLEVHNLIEKPSYIISADRRVSFVHVRITQKGQEYLKSMAK